MLEATGVLRLRSTHATLSADLSRSWLLVLSLTFPRGIRCPSVIALPELAGGRCCAQGWAWVVTARITRSGVAYLALPEMRSPKPRRDRV